MTRSAHFDFTIGDKTLLDLNIRHLIDSITFTEEVGKFDSVVIELQAGPELNKAYPLLRHGSVFQLSMGYNGEAIRPMMLGFLKGVEISCDKRTVTIKIYGYLAALAKGKKTRVLQNRTLQQVVTEIISEYSPLRVGTIENGDTLISDTNSQSEQTDLECLESLARKFGLRWKLEPTETVGVWAVSLYEMGNAGESDADSHPTLVHNPYEDEQSIFEYRHLKVFDVESNIMGISSNVTVLSNNPNRPVTVNSDIYDPTIYQTEVRGSEIVYEVFGAVNKIQFYENVSNEEAAQIIADALLVEDELQFVSSKNGELAEGDSDFRVGQYRHIILNEFPLFGDVFSGDYVVTKTVHKMSKSSSYVTTFESNRSALTPPPPPPIPIGGGGGIAGGDGIMYRLYFDSNGLVCGYTCYKDYTTGEIVNGTQLSPEQVLANPFLREQVNIHYTAAYQTTQVGGEYIDPMPIIPPYLQGQYTASNTVDPDAFGAMSYEFSVLAPSVFLPTYMNNPALNTLQEQTDNLYGTNDMNVVLVNVPVEYGDGALYVDVKTQSVNTATEVVDEGIGVVDINSQGLYYTSVQYQRDQIVQANREARLEALKESRMYTQPPSLEDLHERFGSD